MTDPILEQDARLRAGVERLVAACNPECIYTTQCLKGGRARLPMKPFAELDARLMRWSAPTVGSRPGFTFALHFPERFCGKKAAP